MAERVKDDLHPEKVEGDWERLDVGGGDCALPRLDQAGFEQASVLLEGESASLGAEAKLLGARALAVRTAVVVGGEAAGELVLAIVAGLAAGVIVLAIVAGLPAGEMILPVTASVKSSTAGLITKTGAGGRFSINSDVIVANTRAGSTLSGTASAWATLTGSIPSATEPSSVAVASMAPLASELTIFKSATSLKEFFFL